MAAKKPVEKVLTLIRHQLAQTDANLHTGFSDVTFNIFPNNRLLGPAKDVGVGLYRTTAVFRLIERIGWRNCLYD
jgi:hypothetical protein